MTDWPSVTGQSEAWTHIDTQILGAPAASISFAGIAAAAAPRLRLYTYLIKDGSSGLLNVRFNNDAAANYAIQRLQADGAGTAASRHNAQVQINVNRGGSQSANAPALSLLTIEKPVAGEVARVLSQLSFIFANNITWQDIAGEWDNLAALINRVDFIASAGNFVAGTRAVLEGAA